VGGCREQAEAGCGLLQKPQGRIPVRPLAIMAGVRRDGGGHEVIGAAVLLPERRQPGRSTAVPMMQSGARALGPRPRMGWNAVVIPALRPRNRRRSARDGMVRPQ
jgi:hypothetical protein